MTTAFAAPQGSSDGQSRPGGWSLQEEQLMASKIREYEVWEEVNRRCEEKRAQAAAAASSSWDCQDPGPFLRGEILPVKPSVGAPRSDGKHMLYSGRDHSVIAATSAGKSWFMCWHAAAELSKGNSVIYIHFEEQDNVGTLERLQLLGATEDQLTDLFTFIGPNTPIPAGRIDQLVNLKPTLVVLDGVNQGIHLLGGDHFAIGGAAEWKSVLEVPFTGVGAATIAADHLPLANGNNKRADGYGSVHKGAGLTGARFKLERRAEFGRNLRGVSHLYLTKDRPGWLGQHGTLGADPEKIYFGSMVVDAVGLNRFSMEVTAPSGAGSEGVLSDYETLKNHIYATLLEQPDHQVNSERMLFSALRSAGVQFSNTTAKEAIDDMLMGDPPRVAQVRGKGGAKIYRAVESASTGTP